MANKATIKVESYNNYGPGSFVRRKVEKNDVFIVIDCNKHIAVSEKGYVIDFCHDSFICLPISGHGTPCNLNGNEIETFVGKITITI